MSHIENIFVGINKYWRAFLNEPDNGERLFLIALACFLFELDMRHTMFRGIGWMATYFSLIVKLCLAIKFVFFDKYTKRQLLLGTLLLLDGLLVSKVSGYNNVLYWSLMFLMAKGVDFEKILKTYFVVVGSVVSVAVLGALVGVIQNLAYIDRENELFRYAFGGVYPTNFAGHICFLMLAYLYLNRNSLNLFNISVCLMIDFIIFSYSCTRLDCLCMLFAICGFGYLNMNKRPKPYLRLVESLIARYGIYVMPISAIFFFGLTWFYDPNIPFMNMLDDILSTRLSLGNKGLMENNITLFGQYVYFKTSAMFAGNHEFYFFVDSSYLNYYLRYGLIFTCSLIGIHMLGCRKYKDDVCFIFAICIVALNAMIAQHLMEYNYNVWPMALIAKRHVDWWKDI